MELIELTRDQIERIGREFGYEKPRVREAAHVVGFLGLSPADSIALGSLIVAVWAYLFPRHNGPRCPHRQYFSNRVCGRPLISIRYDPTNKELQMHCGLGHTTIQRTSRVYK